MASILGGGGNTNILPGRGLINPAFVIKIVPATDELQQPKNSSRKNPNDDFLSNLVAGDEVDFKQNGKDMSGAVHRITKNALGDVVFVIVIDNNGHTHKVNATAVHSRKKYSDDSSNDDLVSSPAIFNESKWLSFSEYINMQ